VAVLRRALRPDGHQVTSGGMNTSIRLWEAGDGSADNAVYVLSGHTAAILSVAYSPDGRRLLSSGFDHEVLVWDADDGSLLYAFPDHDTITISIAVRPDGELLATCDDNFVVRLWQLAPTALRFGPLAAVELPSICGCVPRCVGTPAASRTCASTRIAAGSTARVWTRPSECGMWRAARA
jgi:WD40 repeat protein